MQVKKPIKLLIDNMYQKTWQKNAVLQGRNKHIEARFHFLREQLNNRRFEIVHCPTKSQATDVFTKGELRKHV